MPGETSVCAWVDEDSDAENDAAKTEKQGPFAVRQKA
jgi:hypothetical protein